MGSKSKSFIGKRWLLLFVFLFLIQIIQLPFYYSQPGGALALNDIITVEDGYEEKGSFMLTTVRMGRANVVYYIWAHLSPDRTLVPIKQVRLEGETDEEYAFRQMMAMKHSQEAAKIVAYKHAGLPVSSEHKGVLVTSLIKDMPAYNYLQQGDHIIKIEGEPVYEADDLIERLKGKTVSDQVHITIERDGEEKTFLIGFSPFPETYNVPKDEVGIGLSGPITDQVYTFNPSVQIDTSKIGGPSAGLMFSLEIYNQLVEDDLTKGYHIAGTGTINEAGEVGRIGGISQKVIAAHKEGANFFLAPYEGGKEDSNYVEAKKTAKKIKTDMEIVPVETFDDALTFLQSLS